MAKPYAIQVKEALRAELGSKVKFWKGYATRKPLGYGWRTRNGKPVALILHHTGGAATQSQNPANPGNKTGANNGQVKFVSNHPSYGVPCSQFCLDRDGTLYAYTAFPTYHAGTGTFAGKNPWKSLGVPRNAANSYCMGVEIVSKGLTDDLTDAQWKTLAGLMRALSKVNGWKSTDVARRPRHKDWAGPRKVDLRATNNRVTAMLNRHRG